MIGQTISHYRILEKLGEGGMGEVYLAEDTDLQRKVAIKFLPSGYASDPDALARFKREARAAASLNHPNIITIYEVAEDKGRPYIVMAHVDGEPLSALIARKSLPLDKILNFAMQIAEGLGGAHRAGVVHRDIKPGNILIDNEANVKILDFGLAKLGGVTKLTKESSTLGTIHYMSPEQARTSDVDHRSDLFSLGTILYEMITGQLPFQGDHAAAIAYSITSEEPQPLARFSNQASPELQRIISKALAKDPGERYQSAADLVADLRHERRLSVTGMSAAAIPVTPPPSRRRALRFVVPASIVGVAAALILIFKPFTFEVAPDQPAVAAENTLAIMYFDNKTDRQDEQRLGEIVADLLITDLSESPSLKVLSSQRLYDILKLEGKEGVKSLDAATSTGVAKRAGVKWMLMGSILQVEPAMVVTSQLIEAETGAVASSQRVTGAPGENVFVVADKLSDEIRSDMAVPVVSPGSTGESGIKVSTRSETAYRYYLEGVEYENQYHATNAEESFHKALEHDSTFAMAHFRLAGFGSHDERIRAIEKAREYSTNVTQREKLWIEARYALIHNERDLTLDRLKKITELFPEDKEAFLRLGRLYLNFLGDKNEAIRCYRRAIEIDPLYKLAYNDLAYAYESVGDLDQSIWSINKYIEIAPNESNPYDTRADLYALGGKVDEAITSYKKALEMRPDSWLSMLKLGHMYRARRDYSTAEALYRRLLNTDDPETRSYARLHLAALFAYQGKLALALEQFDQGIAADRIEKIDTHWGYYDKLYVKGRIYALQKDYDKALATIEPLAGRNLGRGETSAPFICEWSATSGRLDRAERIAEELKKSANTRIEYRDCMGRIAFARGQFDEAVDHFAWLVDNDPGLWSRFPLARAYQEANRLSEAVRVYEAILSRYDESWAVEPTIAVMLHYYTGLAYERSGWNDRAIERYEEFLTIWKDADPGIGMVDDAKRRLAALRKGS